MASIPDQADTAPTTPALAAQARWLAKQAARLLDELTERAADEQAAYQAGLDAGIRLGRDLRDHLDEEASAAARHHEAWRVVQNVASSLSHAELVALRRRNTAQARHRDGAA